jgi:hypothetical protein
VRYRGGVCLRSDEEAYGEAFGPCVGVSRQSLEGIFSEVRPRIHREFIATRYGLGGVGLSPERLLFLSRAARWCPLDSPFSLAPIHRSAWNRYSANFAQTEFSEVRHSLALGKELSEALARYAAPDFRGETSTS